MGFSVQGILKEKNSMLMHDQLETSKPRNKLMVYKRKIKARKYN
jgi:hypothetical protein